MLQLNDYVQNLNLESVSITLFLYLYVDLFFELLHNSKISTEKLFIQALIIEYQID
jgi:hypothetical protein